MVNFETIHKFGLYTLLESFHIGKGDFVHASASSISRFVSLSMRYVNLSNLIKSHMNNLTLDPHPPSTQPITLDVLTQYSIHFQTLALFSP